VTGTGMVLNAAPADAAPTVIDKVRGWVGQRPG